MPTPRPDDRPLLVNSFGFLSMNRAAYSVLTDQWNLAPRLYKHEATIVSQWLAKTSLQLTRFESVNVFTQVAGYCQSRNACSRPL